MRFYSFVIHHPNLCVILFFILLKVNIYAQSKIFISQNTYTAVVINQGVVDCFAEGLKNSKGDSVSCETSAVLYYNGNLIFASDKDIPGKSPVFSIAFKDELEIDSIRFHISPELVNTVKYEDFTITNDGKYIFASTAFDRINEDHSWDKYNKLMYWKSGKDDSVYIVGQTEYNNIKSSVLLRKYFAKALANDSFPNGMPYFKIEGLMCIDNNLFFGVRETGKKYDDFQYRIAVISAKFKMKNDIIDLDTNFKLVYDYKVQNSLDIIEPVALSGIEYDKYNKRIYLLTSFEITKKAKAVGGYLWVLTLDNFKKNKPPVLATKKDGSVLLFNHKPDGITVIDKNTVFIVCDDDRVVGENEIFIPEMPMIRKLNQFVYYVVKFN